MITLGIHKKMLMFAQNHVTHQKNIKVFHALDSIFTKKNQKVIKVNVFFKLNLLKAMIRPVLLVTPMVTWPMILVPTLVVTNLIMINQQENADVQMVANNRLITLLVKMEIEVSLAVLNSIIPHTKLIHANKYAPKTKNALVSMPKSTLWVPLGPIAISKQRM